jgi:hypothetical protein
MKEGRIYSSEQLGYQDQMFNSMRSEAVFNCKNNRPFLRIDGPKIFQMSKAFDVDIPLEVQRYVFNIVIHSSSYMYTNLDRSDFERKVVDVLRLAITVGFQQKLQDGVGKGFSDFSQN